MTTKKPTPLLRSLIRGLYDYQKLRIGMGNRIFAAFRHKLDLAPSDAEEDNPAAKKLLDELRMEYKRVTDGVSRITRRTKIKSPLINDYTELKLLEAYESALKTETIQEQLISIELEKQSIWTAFLVNVRGVGPLMAAVIISEVDIHQCNSVSALKAYAGLDVVLVTDEETGEVTAEGRGRKKAHLVDRKYTNREGEHVDTKGISFNPFLKTKLVGVLGTSFIKLGGPYRDVYDNYKHRLSNMPEHVEKSLGHRHNMAVRYMIKMFLTDLWKKWRELEGYGPKETYAEAVLDIHHHEDIDPTEGAGGAS